MANRRYTFSVDFPKINILLHSGLNDNCVEIGKSLIRWNEKSALLPSSSSSVLLGFAYAGRDQVFFFARHTCWLFLRVHTELTHSRWHPYLHYTREHTHTHNHGKGCAHCSVLALKTNVRSSLFVVYCAAPLGYPLASTCMPDESLSTGRMIAFTVLSFHPVKSDGRFVKHGRCNVLTIIPPPWAVCVDRPHPNHLERDHSW